MYDFISQISPTHLQTVFIVNHDQVANMVTKKALVAANISVQEFVSPSDLLNSLPLRKPGCFLIDFILPEVNGLHLMEVLRRSSCFQPVIFCSSRIEPELIIKAMNRGAFGFIKKPFQQIELIDIVQRALNREYVLRHYIQPTLDYRQRLLSLSKREHQILNLLEKDYKAKDIAIELNLSRRTVENHRARILNKLNFSSRERLLRQVIIHNLLRASGVLD